MPSDDDLFSGPPPAPKKGGAGDLFFGPPPAPTPAPAPASGPDWASVGHPELNRVGPSQEVNAPRGIMPRIGEGISSGFGESRVTPQEMQQYPVLGTVAKTLELPGRTFGAITGAAAGAISGAAEKAGMLPTNADRLMRDLSVIGMGLGIGEGMSGRSSAPRPVEINRPRAAPPLEQTISPRAAPMAVAESVGEVVKTRVAEKEALESQQYKAALDREGQTAPGAMHGVAGKIKTDIEDSSNLRINKKLTPNTNRALKDLSGMRGFAEKAPADPMAPLTGTKPQEGLAVELRSINEARRTLGRYRSAAYKSGDETDILAMNMVMAAFDKHVDNIFAQGLFSGEGTEIWSALKEARKTSAELAKWFDPKTDGGKAVQKIVQKGATPEEIAKMLYGMTKIGNTGGPVRVIQHLETMLGPQHPIFGQIKNAYWQHALDRKNGVRELVDSTIGKKMFDPQTRSLMHRLIQKRENPAITERLKTAIIAGIAGAATGILSHTAVTGMIKPVVEHSIKKRYGGVEE